MSNDHSGQSPASRSNVKATVKWFGPFRRPFSLDGFKQVLSAGVDGVESETDILDGMFLPESRRTSVLIHLHSTFDRSAYVPTLTVSCRELEAAQLRDRSLTVTPPEPGLEEKLAEPIICLLMRSDGVSRTSGRDTNSRLSKRTFSHANAE